MEKAGLVDSDPLLLVPQRVTPRKRIELLIRHDLYVQPERRLEAAANELVENLPGVRTRQRTVSKTTWPAWRWSRSRPSESSNWRTARGRRRSPPSGRPRGEDKRQRRSSQLLRPDVDPPQGIGSAQEQRPLSSSS